jgi:hypothetical protein
MNNKISFSVYVALMATIDPFDAIDIGDPVFLALVAVGFLASAAVDVAVRRCVSRTAGNAAR